MSVFHFSTQQTLNALPHSDRTIQLGAEAEKGTGSQQNDPLYSRRAHARAEKTLKTDRPDKAPPEPRRQSVYAALTISRRNHLHGGQMRPSPVICWLASRVTGDWLGQKEEEKKGGRRGGCYQLDSEPNHAAVQRSRMQAGVAQSQCVAPVRRVNKRGNLY
ncbi:hypothetical protein EYF80_010603 [Liparis tanakae]|uniref:Uncharacterized protein n=1 Tax=Liparis tanakae TaxID=230148 RepID=A0A4Z2IMS6_9TELE|nr:hypothetical protein EYF80_010603 [Liparis tanakae]